ncbi:MAG: hypothetical protein AAFR03_05515 [Pseudomonadota bacterium]
MSQFVFLVDPPALGANQEPWGYKECTDQASLLDQQSILFHEKKIFSNAVALTLNGLTLNDLREELHYFEDESVVWKSQFPELIKFLVLKSSGVFCFFGSFERENYHFVSRVDVLKELEKQLSEFPVELNFLYYQGA